ncbi:MAG: hypothetical protein ACLGXA_11450 [Acidobacteriota bacterium]
MKRLIGLLCLLLVTGVSLCRASEPNAIRNKVARNTTIQGYPCARGAAWFYPDGALDQCTLSRAAAVGDLRVPRGSVIELWADGGVRYVMLPRAMALAGFRVRGGSQHALSRGVTTAFYRNGELHSFYLVRNQVIAGVPCRGGAWNTFTDPLGGENLVELYPNGKLESCALSRDFGGFRSGERIHIPQLNFSAALVDPVGGYSAQ